MRILTLDDTFFVEYGDKNTIDHLGAAIEIAENFEKKWGLPTCDFQMFPVHKLNMEMTARQSLDMKLRLMKKRLLLLSKLNKYQKNFFELQVNSAMDKAISDELLIKSFLDRKKKN